MRKNRIAPTEPRVEMPPISMDGLRSIGDFRVECRAGIWILSGPAEHGVRPHAILHKRLEVPLNAMAALDPRPEWALDFESFIAKVIAASQALRRKPYNLPGKTTILLEGVEVGIGTLVCGKCNKPKPEDGYPMRCECIPEAVELNLTTMNADYWARFGDA